jgi:3-oxoacyl-[acyl-carrier-protein] synthase-3
MASHLQARLGAQGAIPFNLQQGCNGNLIALELAGAYLQANAAASRALVVATDRFGTTSFDRFTSDYGVVYGDAATALVLGRAPSALRVCGLVTESIAEAEAMHRDAHESVDGELNHFDVRETKRRFLAEHGKETFSRRCHDALKRIGQQLLGGAAEREVDHIVFPNLGRQVLEENYYPAFRDAERKALWDFGRTVGHLGTADAVAGLYELSVARGLRAGRRVLVIGAGAGFTLSGLLVESS